MNNLSNDDEDRKAKKKRLSSTMFLYIRELLFFFALAFTSYATLFNGMPKVGRPPLPVPFFPASSIVPDFYKGSMGKAFNEGSKADFAVVMFYAPWDAESQSTRPIFDAVARYFSDEIYFAAVNCWAPGSECKQHSRKIRSYPVIVVYPQQGSGIQYQGPLIPAYLIRFLRAMLRPITRIQSLEEVAHLFKIYDAVVVGSFLFEGNLGGRGYFTFYSSALKMLEKDYHHDIAFAVTTNEADADAVHVNELPSIRLFLWNETHDFPLDADYTDETVANWAWQKTQRAARWLSPPGTKAATIYPILANNPALIVFSPRQPLATINPIFNLIKELAIRYYNCDSDPWTFNLANILNDGHKFHQNRMQRLEVKCSRLKRSEKSKKLVTSTVITANALTNRSGCNVCGVSSPMLVGPQLEVCARPMGSSSLNQSSSTFRYETSMWNPENDASGAAVLLNKKELDDCKLLETSYSYQKMWYPRTVASEALEVIEGLSCSNNRTLSMALLDSKLYYQFADGLGIQLANKPHNTVAVIVDPRAESQYVMDEPVSQYSLVQFIMNHTQGILKAHFRSTESPKASSLLKHRYSPKRQSECGHSDTESCVVELHSGNFLSTVMNTSEAVVVFYHSPMCALCRSIAHIFLLISRYFRHFPVLKFARIDGENNDLPWSYTVDTYPSIIFFPITNKAESRLFSENRPFTVRNLMHFVLANLQQEAKVPAMLSLCMNFEKQQTDEEIKLCTTKIKLQVQEGLSNTLKKIRSVMGRWVTVKPESMAASLLHREKSELILSLQYFRATGFILGSVDRPSMCAAEILELYLKFLRTLQMRYREAQILGREPEEKTH